MATLDFFRVSSWNLGKLWMFNYKISPLLIFNINNSELLFSLPFSNSTNICAEMCIMQCGCKLKNIFRSIEIWLCGWEVRLCEPWLNLPSVQEEELEAAGGRSVEAGKMAGTCWRLPCSAPKKCNNLALITSNMQCFSCEGCTWQHWTVGRSHSGSQRISSGPWQSQERCYEYQRGWMPPGWAHTNTVKGRGHEDTTSNGQWEMGSCLWTSNPVADTSTNCPTGGKTDYQN